MLTSKDLMIGDWYAFQGHPYKCTASDIEALAECEEKGVPTDISEIPLTAEILDRNGFEIDKNETYCKRYFFACNLGKVPQTVVEFSFYGEGVSADTLFKCWTKPESCDGENSIHICDLKSVHELQHCLNLVGIKKDIVL
jgi:hypothetical protein